MIKRLFNFATNRIYNLPVVVLMPHSRCNCRCVMCDIWKANQNKREISAEELEKHVSHFGKLGVREVVLSGGEALMHTNLWSLCAILHKQGIKITLLSTGLLLEKNAPEIIANCNQVVVSLDGSPEVHNAIRNIPQAFEKLAGGVSALKKLRPALRVTARCVLQRHNFSDFFNIVESSKVMGLDQISFLAADISTPAFNRSGPWSGERVSEIALNKTDTAAFEELIEISFIKLKSEYRSKRIAESPQKMRKIVQYYKAVNHMSEFPPVVCNAPWVSAVIESDGSVMPCFFHKPYGNVNDGDFIDILNSPQAIHFRKNLNVKKDPVCKKCVCSLSLGLTEMN